MGIIEQYGHGLEIPKDELTAIERDRLLSEGKEVDRIMCCIDTGETLAPMIGLKVKDYYFSSEKMLELYPDFTYVWSYNGDASIIPGNPIVVKRGSDEFYEYMAQAGSVINNTIFPIWQLRKET